MANESCIILGKTVSSLDCIILDNWVFEIFTPFAKVLRILQICVLVNNDLGGKLISSLELLSIFDERFIVTSLPFFVLLLID